MPNIKYLFYYHLVLEDFESSIGEYQQYNVLNSSRKRINLTHYQDPVIYTAVCHQHTSDICVTSGARNYPQSDAINPTRFVA